MRVLITGGAGFIGSHLASSFSAADTVRVLDNFRTGHRGNLESLCAHTEVLEGSILEESVLQAAMEQVEYVFHLAAMVSVPESVADPAGCEEINTIGTLRVLEAARRAGVRKVFFASSAAVYGNHPAVPTPESALPAPHSPYAISKLAGEHYAGFYHREGRVRTVALRFYNVFGPRQNPDGAYAAAVPHFIRCALRNDPLPVHGDGGQTRDFIPVRDIVAAIRHVTLRDDPTGVFNAGTGAPITVRQLAASILELTGSSSSGITFQPARAGDVRHSSASIDALTATGFRGTTSLEAGLRETIDSLRNSTSGSISPPTRT